MINQKVEISDPKIVPPGFWLHVNINDRKINCFKRDEAWNPIEKACVKY